MPNAEWLWKDGSLVRWEDAQVHVLSHALHYGTSVFEGVKCYSTKDGAKVFRLRDHAERLLRSARVYGMKPDYSADDLCSAALETIKANGLEGCYIRPFIFYGAGEIGVLPTTSPIVTVVCAFDWPAYLYDSGSGIRVLLSSVRRIHSAATPPESKAAGHYLNSLLAKREATAAGFDEAILANEAGHFVEGTAQNLFMVRDGVLVTPPIHEGVLPGITRASVMSLAAKLGISVEERPILRGDLMLAPEIFLTGTATEIAAVGEISGRALDAPGPVTVALLEAFQAVLDGELPEFAEWLTRVEGRTGAGVDGPETVSYANG